MQTSHSTYKSLFFQTHSSLATFYVSKVMDLESVFLFFCASRPNVLSFISKFNAAALIKAYLPESFSHLSPSETNFFPFSLSLSFSFTLFSHSFEPADNNLVKICTAYRGCRRRVLWMRLPGQHSGASGIWKRRFTFLFFPSLLPRTPFNHALEDGAFKLLVTRQRDVLAEMHPSLFSLPLSFLSAAGVSLMCFCPLSSLSFSLFLVHNRWDLCPK